MLLRRPILIDCHYTKPQIAASYLLESAGELAFVEVNTNSSVPRLLKQVKELGFGPEDVKWIIITHIHLDHAGGAGELMKLCPNATLLAHERAAPHAINPAKIVKGATAVYGAEVFKKLYGTVQPIEATRVVAVEENSTVKLGELTLHFLYTRGHANHHMCVWVPKLQTVFTGDSFGIGYPSLQEHGTFFFPSSSPTDFDASAAIQSVQRIVSTGVKTVCPTHFGEFSEVEEISRQLLWQLRAYRGIVSEADEMGVEGEQLRAFCLERVRVVFEHALRQRGFEELSEAWEVLSLDLKLNGEGLAAAVNKLRYKRSLK